VVSGWDVSALGRSVRPLSFVLTRLKDIRDIGKLVFKAQMLNVPVHFRASLIGDWAEC